MILKTNKKWRVFNRIFETIFEKGHLNIKNMVNNCKVVHRHRIENGWPHLVEPAGGPVLILNNLLTKVSLPFFSVETRWCLFRQTLEIEGSGICTKNCCHFRFRKGYPEAIFRQMSSWAVLSKNLSLPPFFIILSNTEFLMNLIS